MGTVNNKHLWIIANYLKKSKQIYLFIYSINRILPMVNIVMQISVGIFKL